MESRAKTPTPKMRINDILLTKSIQNTVVQSIELQGNRSGTSKSRQNSRGTGIAFASGILLMTVELTDMTIQEWPQLK